MQSTSPLVFLGLDGLPWSLARELSVQGLLPNLTRVMDTSGPIRAELPELSPVNLWKTCLNTVKDHSMMKLKGL